MRRMLMVVAVALLCGMVWGQEPAQDVHRPPPSFEVASIKVHNSPAVGGIFQTSDPSHFRTIHIPAKNLVTYAYNIKGFQVSGGPSWIQSTYYDIEAKVDDTEVAKMRGMTPDDAREEMRLMVRSLLGERFKLSVSHSTKDEPEFALVVAKGGPKLIPTTWVAPDPALQKSGAAPKNGPGLVIGPGQQFRAVDQPVSSLVDVLAVMPELGGKLIVDQTGIKGNYDYTVHFSSDELNQKMAASGLPMPATGPPPTDDAAPSIFTALEEQLGLKLEMTHGPVDIYTIDRIEQPTEN